jgi:hypothetical protein
MERIYAAPHQPVELTVDSVDEDRANTTILLSENKKSQELVAMRHELQLDDYKIRVVSIESDDDTFPRIVDGNGQEYPLHSSHAISTRARQSDPICTVPPAVQSIRAKFHSLSKGFDLIAEKTYTHTATNRSQAVAVCASNCS